MNLADRLNRQVIILIGVVAFAVMLAIVVGNQLVSVQALAIALGVAAGIIVGVPAGILIMLYGLRNNYVRVDDLVDYFEAQYASVAPASTAPAPKKRTRTAAAPPPEEETLAPRRERDFSAVGWTEPPTGFEDDD